MTLQEIANFGEILGAAGVIASLVFVGWQIKTNTKTARMRMHEQITHTFLSFLKHSGIGSRCVCGGSAIDK